MSGELEHEEQKVYVSLDLGSESMAAYYEDLSGKGEMIDLQARAAALLGQSGRVAAAQEIAYLTEELDGHKKRSPRLWNRISLRDEKQPQDPGEAHATLLFQDKTSYEQSLFSYFHTITGWPPDEKVLPNPKILFQHQIRAILPTVRANDGRNVNLSPEMLIKHLTLQVIRNFLLNSNELKDIEPKRVHLTITIPNVYSLPHALSLREYIATHAGVGSVEVLSESDAVACSVLSGPDDSDPPELCQLKTVMEKSLTERKRLSLLTIDIGKGTTDLSCILVEEPKRPQPIRQFLARLMPRRTKVSKEGEDQQHLKYSVLGKTGRSSGGTYLSFLIARHYDTCLQLAADKVHSASQLSVPFGFITKSDNVNWDSPQLHAISELEKLIDLVKQSITEQFEIDEAILNTEKQREMLNPVVNRMLQALNPAWSHSAETDNEKAFREQVLNALVLPQKLGDLGWQNVFDWIKPILPFFRKQQSKHVLRPSLESYIKENVDDLLDSLRSLVKEHQVGSQQSDVIDKNVFVVVAGQASQFRPLRQSILEKCRRLGISRNHIHLMSGVRAKEACCKGVVNFKNLQMLIANPTELHGTYGCLAVGMRPKDQQFKPFDMRQIKNGGTAKIAFDAAVDHYVIFTPRAYREVLNSQPKKNDGATALIARLENTNKFSIEYNQKTLELKVNGRRLELRGFGDVDGSIYPKVWPEIVAPNPK